MQSEQKPMSSVSLSNASPDPALEHEIAAMIVDVLHLDMTATEIDPDAPLFNEGLGLDSIDALELSLALSKRYGIMLRSDDPRNAEIFASLRRLAGFVAESRAE